MDCFICSGAMSPYFSKEFNGECGLRVVHYWRCAGCGLVVSKSHFEMTDREWQQLNHDCHAAYQGGEQNRYDPSWLARLNAQRDNLVELASAGVLPRRRPWIDYGCGDGKLADMLGMQDLPTLKYDKYAPAHEAGFVGDEALRCKFPVVINTSVLEHVRGIEALDEMANLVDDDGVFALHTLVRESIPNDPTWFYLMPVHTVFYTNRSMQTLFDRWRFTASIYHVPSRMWFAYRREPGCLAEFVERKQAAGSKDFCYKRGFVDYWK